MRAYPLALSFHGNGSSMVTQEQLTGFSELADHLSFFVIYPEGTMGPNGLEGWSSGGRSHPSLNDTLFVSDLLTQAQSQFCVDPARIYATGFSNGGGMTSVLACRLAGRIAAFASVSGSYYPLPGGCAPARPAPILEVHGTGDGIVPYQGDAAIHLMSTQAWLQQWAKLDGCAPTPQIAQLASDLARYTWTGCRGGVDIEHLQRVGGGHVWPRRALAANGAYTPAVPNLPQVTQVIWQFVSTYRLTVAPSRAPGATAPTRNSAPPR